MSTYYMTLGDLCLEVECDYDPDDGGRVWADTVYVVQGEERIDLSDLLDAAEKSRSGWRWRDWLEDTVLESIRRSRQEAA